MVLRRPSLEDTLSRLLKTSPENIHLTKLHGDASNRIYFRLERSQKESIIVMKLPEGALSASEEITNLKTKPKEMPFLNVQKYLHSLHLPVPQIILEAPEEGIILLEDLGNETFEKRIGTSSPPEKIEWYQKAIDLLVDLQTKTTTPSTACIAFERSFDEKLLNWEFDHFLEYGIEARQNVKISEDDRRTILRWTHWITFGLTQLPKIFVHRDFQSRNLMVVQESLKLIDFQDALLGPLPYDLVALLRDSYIVLPAETVSKLIDYYCDRYQKKGTDKLDLDFFKKMFDWMTIQRKLKDAGRFIYIDKVKKNPSFLPFTTPSLQYVREALERQKELKPLWEILKKYAPELN